MGLLSVDKNAYSLESMANTHGLVMSGGEKLRYLFYFIVGTGFGTLIERFMGWGIVIKWAGKFTGWW